MVDKFQDPEELIDIIEPKVRSGEISEHRINEAYKRIVTLKKTLIKSPVLAQRNPYTDESIYGLRRANPKKA